MAITRDTQGGADGSGSTLTKSLTLTTANVLLMIGTTRSATNDITGATWNGVAMGLKDTFNKNTGLYSFKTFYLESPDTGTHDLVLSRTNSGTDIELFAVAYSNVILPLFDASGTGSSGSASSFSDSLTTITDLSQVVFLIGGANGSATAGTNTTKVGQDDQCLIMEASTTTSPPGSTTLAWTTAGTTDEAFWSKLSLGGTNSTNIKTFDGLASASVKTVDGLARASVKSWNGLT